MEKKIKYSDVKLRIFNVVIQPTEKQCKENYIALIEKIFEKAKKYETSSKQFTKIHSLNKTEKIYSGSLVNFSVLDTDRPWYNEEKNELQQMEVDPNLNPNGKFWDFYFYPEYHRIGIPARRGVSFAQVKNYLIQDFKEAAGALGYEDVVVNVVTSAECIELIFKLEKIDKLSIEVTYSNNDNFEAFDKAIEDEMREENVGCLKVHVESPKRGSIVLKKRSYIGSLLRFSKNNGKAKANGHIDGRPFKINTDNYPKVVKMKKVGEDNLLRKVKEAIESVL